MESREKLKEKNFYSLGFVNCIKEHGIECSCSFSSILEKKFEQMGIERQSSQISIIVEHLNSLFQIHLQQNSNWKFIHELYTDFCKEFSSL
jgi:hypothetical protein